MQSTKSGVTTRKLTVTAMLSAVASVLMFIDFSVPLMPSFIKMDVSEFPALLASFSLGPIYGAAVCLVKNLVNLIFHSSTGGVGELCNFMLGAFFTIPAGLIYQRDKTRRGAIIGSIVGAALMALLSLPLNYYITYPMYTTLGYPIEAIVGMYQAINPNVDGLLACLVTFNIPFTFVKGMLDVLITVLIYKRLSPILHGRSA